MKKKGKQPVILTKLSAWDKAQHRKDLSSADVLVTFLRDAPGQKMNWGNAILRELVQRFERTFGGE